MLVSADTDFGTLLALRRERFPSVVLFRRGTATPRTTGSPSPRDLSAIEDDLARGGIVVFEPDRIRVRALPIGE